MPAGHSEENKQIVDNLRQLLSPEPHVRGYFFRRVGYFTSVMLACALLVAGLLVYGHGRLRGDFQERNHWQQALPMVAMAYGSLLLLAVAIVEIRVKHVRAGALVVRNQTLDDVVEYLASCQEQERAQLSGRLHDDVGGLLAALKLELESDEWGECLSKESRHRARRLLDQLFAEIRGMAALLYPRMIGLVGVKGALAELASRLNSKQIHLAMDVDPQVDQLDATAGLCVLRVVQEAIVNAGRHGRASRIQVKLAVAAGQLHGVVDDDGRGKQDTTEGMGLTLMRERLRRLGGELDLDASPHGGVRLRFVLPMTADSMKKGCA